ncbi:unnamed protein product [Phytomonas sp. Hart1]|nr:unnamed protein product [Phytomonas sp. Hart1]|eukprot:CCW70305.1 unnamed protein product [Phytomonas sp. isolate Hart1]
MQVVVSASPSSSKNSFEEINENGSLHNSQTKQIKDSPNQKVSTVLLSPVKIDLNDQVSLKVATYHNPSNENSPLSSTQAPRQSPMKLDLEDGLFIIGCGIQQQRPIHPAPSTRKIAVTTAKKFPPKKVSGGQTVKSKEKPFTITPPNRAPELKKKEKDVAGEIPIKKGFHLSPLWLNNQDSSLTLPLLSLRMRTRLSGIVWRVWQALRKWQLDRVLLRNFHEDWRWNTIPSPAGVELLKNFGLYFYVEDSAGIELNKDTDKGQTSKSVQNHISGQKSFKGNNISPNDHSSKLDSRSLIQGIKPHTFKRLECDEDWSAVMELWKNKYSARPFMRLYLLIPNELYTAVNDVLRRMSLVEDGVGKKTENQH